MRALRVTRGVGWSSRGRAPAGAEPRAEAEKGPPPQAASQAREEPPRAVAAKPAEKESSSDEEEGEESDATSEKTIFYRIRTWRPFLVNLEVDWRPMSKSARPVEREGTSVKAEENPDYEPEAGAGDGQAANISGCTGQKRTHTSSCTGAWTIRTSDSIQQLRGSRQLPASPRGQGNDSRSRGRFGGPGRSRALYGPFDVIGTARWNTLTPVVGDIVTSMIPGELVEEEGVEGIWLVTGLELAADGSKMLRVKSVGSSSPSLLGVLSSLFNRKEGRLHICAGPGACHEEGAVFHVRRLEVWRGSEFPAQRLSPRGKKIIRHFARGEALEVEGDSRAAFCPQAKSTAASSEGGQERERAR